MVRALQRTNRLSADSVIVDGELRKAMMELPAFFQPDPNTRGPPSQDPKALVQYYEKIMLNLAIHSRMLRLHRPWLSRGYEDER